MLRRRSVLPDDHVLGKACLRLALFGLVALGLVLMASCAQHEQMIGRILDVEGEGVLQPRSIRLIDQEGRQWLFELNEVFGHFTTSHLRQHMLSGEMVEVTFRREGTILVVEVLRDYP